MALMFVSFLYAHITNSCFSTKPISPRSHFVKRYEQGEKEEEEEKEEIKEALRIISLQLGLSVYLQTGAEGVKKRRHKTSFPPHLY